MAVRGAEPACRRVQPSGYRGCCRGVARHDLEDAVKVAATVGGLVLFGWALVAAADSRHEALEPVVVTQVHRVEVLVEVEPDTPFADSLVDWPEVERQEACLLRFIQEQGLELSFEMVWAAGQVTDALGGACRVMGEDDEEQG